MNRNLINFLTTILLALVMSFVLPWWSVMIAGLLASLLFPLKKAAVFFMPFWGIALFWLGYGFILSSGNDFILAKKVAVLFPLGGSPYLLLAVTGIIGGIAAGLAAIFGKQLSLLIKN